MGGLSMFQISSFEDPDSANKKVVPDTSWDKHDHEPWSLFEPKTIFHYKNSYRTSPRHLVGPRKEPLFVYPSESPPRDSEAHISPLSFSTCTMPGCSLELCRLCSDIPRNILIPKTCPFFEYWTLTCHPSATGPHCGTWNNDSTIMHYLASGHGSSHVRGCPTIVTWSVKKTCDYNLQFYSFLSFSCLKQQTHPMMTIPWRSTDIKNSMLLKTGHVASLIYPFIQGGAAVRWQSWCT